MRGAVVDEGETVLERLVSDGVPAGLAPGASRPAGRSRASRLWGPDAAPAAERGLGWLDLPERSRGLLSRLAGLAGEARGAGLDRVVLAASGGAAPAAEVIARTSGVELTVLDGTAPGRTAEVLADERLARTLVVLSSRGGAALGVDAHRRIFEDAFGRAGIDGADLARRFVVVTERGSPLAKLAAEEGYRLVESGADVPGRFGALDAPGLVPSALAGADVARLLDEAAALAPTLAQPYDNPALTLGAALGATAAGRGAVVIADQGSAPPGFGGWVEHLVAGATGKQGKGLLPVVVEGVESPGFEPSTGARRVVLSGRPGEHGAPGDGSLGVAGPLGAQFLLWEYATAVAARVAGVNPFDGPDLQESAGNTAALLRAEEGVSPTVIGRAPALVSGAVEVHDPGGVLKGALKGPGTLTAALEGLLSSVPDGGYLAVLAYLDRLGDADAAGLRPLLAGRGAAVRRTSVPVTFGWGPQYLDTTGQYHKGGPQNGAFLLVTADAAVDVPVPGRPYTLGQAHLAQAFGDLRALASRGRPVVRVHLRDRADGLARLAKALTS
jgi:glucose-6-phosphate isomerase